MTGTKSSEEALLKKPADPYRFSIKTLGCKVNQYESESIASELTHSGFAVSSPEKDVDLYIVNTCTVTGKASMQSRQAIRQAIRQNPEALMVVTGCYAQTQPDEIQKIDGVHVIVAQSDKHRLADIIKERLSPSRFPPHKRPHRIWHAIDKHQTFFPLISSLEGRRTRPYLKIQDGCNAFCTYCIVPYTRGRSRSMPVADVLKQLGRIADAGFYETVLTGIHIGNYGADLSPETTLYELLRKIVTATAIPRIRLSSIEPKELSADIIGLAAESDRFCRHFHIPLQSGDDEILKRMHRPYTQDFFKELLNGVYRRIPDCGIGVDVLAGFPGETDQAFENTYRLVEALPVTYLHVFPFSPRKGTPADRFPDPIPPPVIKHRCKELRGLGIKKKKAFYESLIGKTLEVLIEEHQSEKTGLFKGITSNYVPVLVRESLDIRNKLIRANIHKLDHPHAESSNMILIGERAI